MTRYEVWAMCCDKDFNAFYGEEFLGRFNEEAAAIEHAKSFKTVDDIYEADAKEYFIEAGGKYLQIRVEAYNKNTGEVEDIVYAGYVE